MNDTDTTLAIMEPREKPDVNAIILEMRDAMNSAESLGVFQKLELCHLTKRCYWIGQTSDGRLGEPSKDSKNLYWWKGAPESRHHKADQIIMERAGLRELVFYRGQVDVSPSLAVRERESTESQADEWQLTLDYYRRITQRETAYAWRLHSTCVEEMGYSILHVGWKNRYRMDKRTMTSEALLNALVSRVTQEAMAMIAQSGQEPPEDGNLPPEMVAAIQAQAQTELDAMLTDPDNTNLGTALVMSIDPDCSLPEARRAFAQLAAGQTATYYAPQDDGGIPTPCALIPWVNVIHPPSLSGTGEADWFGVPEFIGRPELLSRAASEGWDKDFVEKVQQHPNKMMPELLSTTMDTSHSWVLNGAGIGLYIDQNNVQTETPLFQIIHRWGIAVNAAGLPMVFRTVISPFVTDAYGLHECTKLRSLPFTVDTAEPVNNAMLARGVGQVVVASQNQIIDLLSGEGARAQLGQNPPLQRGVDQHVPVRPGMQIHVRQAGVRPMNEFMTTPQVDKGAIELIRMHEQFINERYFRGETVDPDAKQQHQELLAHQAMESLGAFWRMVWAVIQANVDELRLSRIAGRRVNLHINGDDLQGEAEIEIGFNVAGLSGDRTDKWINVLEKVVGMDRAGSMDWTEAVLDLIMSQNPAMARKLVMPKDVAAKRIVDDQNTRIAQLDSGVPVDYDERATAPDLRMQAMKKWMQVPNNVARAMQDPVIAELFKKEEAYLEAQIEQYQQNPLIGRTLAKPN